MIQYNKDALNLRATGSKIEAKPGKGIYIKDGKKYMMK